MPNYDEQTFEVILQRMLDTISDNFDKRQGSVIYDMLSPSAMELELAYVSLENVKQFGVVNLDMPSDYLDMRVAEVGLERKEATFSKGQVLFTGTAGLTVPAGTRFSTDDDSVTFITDEDVILDGSGNGLVNATAEVGGSDGNISANTVLYVLGDQAGVLEISNPNAFDGGIDEEYDEDLISRFYDRVQKPISSGNANQYLQWAKEVAGVGDAKVYDADSPFGNGAGTVKLVILDSDRRALHPSIDTLVANVLNYIQPLRPVGASVSVVGATEVPLTISATVTLESGYDLADINTAFTSAVTDYLKELAFVDNIVRYNKLSNFLLDVEGVLDFSDFTLNGGSANITIAEGSVAVLGTVTLS